MDTDLHWSDLHWSEFNSYSRYLGLTFDSESSLFASTVNNSDHLLTRDEVHRSLPLHKAHGFPVEVFSEIFLYTVQADPLSRTELMLVCRHWHDIMLSTPGIHSQLRIYSGTKKKDVERFGKRWLLDVTVHPEHVDDPEFEPYIDPRNFHACFKVVAEAASRWRSLALLSLPPPEECKDLQIIHPLQHLESFKLAANCKLGNFLEPLLKAIITTVTPRFTVMEIFHSDAVLYLLQPAHFRIFSSLTTLRLICRGMRDPVDVLPYLHKLETFEAHHLLFPIYPPGVDLPPARTLHVLRLKAVSVQWMAGQIFPALEECSIIFPHHSDAIQSVYMPSCLNLKYHSNNLSALEHFHISTLDKLEIVCGQERTRSGNLQLIWLHPIFAAHSLTCLHLEIKCSDWLLVYMLRLVPALEKLWMGLSSPHALSTTFFLALAAGGYKANAGPSRQTIEPLGRRLRMLHLHYKRWLRGPEGMALIPAFGAVVASHPPEDGFRFHLSLDEGSKLQKWYIGETAEKFEQKFRGFIIGVPSPDGIVHLSRAFGDDNDGGFDSQIEYKYLPPPRESEYIATQVILTLPIEFFLSFRSLKEVRMAGLAIEMKPDTQFSLDTSLFHTLKVLNVWYIPSSFFAGQTFHKLERYKEGYNNNGGIPREGPLTEMPVCTRLDVPLLRLATLKFPQIRELGLSIGAEHDHIWEKRIAVNANLSGLKLLHLRYHKISWPTIAVIKILGSLPALNTLIIGPWFLNFPCVDLFEAFVPMNVSGPFALNQSSREGQISGVLCPKLEYLQIEGIRPTAQAELVPVLKDIVTLRAIIGSPLKSFTFLDENSLRPMMWQLIGRDESFMMEEVLPAQRFELDI